MLALNGGSKVVTSPLRKYRWMTYGDAFRLWRLVNSNNLSGFLAQSSSAHLGGVWVRSLEELSRTKFQSKYSIAVNSWTSGLELIMKSLKLPPESEVLVPPWTMSATVASIANAGLIPRFVDIEIETCNISVDSIENAINSRTKGILGVDIFGRPCRAKELRKISDEHGLFFVVDSAQTPLAKQDGKHSTFYAHAGGFSFNRHKHIQVGEGGMVVTDEERLARRIQYLRNHAEITTLHDSEHRDEGMIGHNFRMGEMESLLAFRQILGIEGHVENRRKWGRQLAKLLREMELPGLRIELPISPDSHDFYILPIILDGPALGLNRDFIATALRAEGVANLVSEYGLLNELPPFRCFPREKLTNATALSKSRFLGIYLCGHKFTQRNLREIANAFQKVWTFLKI